MEDKARLEQLILDLKAEIKEQGKRIDLLVGRIERLENRDIGGGVYLDGVDDLYKTAIQKNLSSQERGDGR